MIETPRLRLVPASIEMLRAEDQDPDRLGALLAASVPDTWPPDLYDDAAIAWTIRSLLQYPAHGDWFLHYLVRKGLEGTADRLVGTGGYKGPPLDGTVEIGYSVVSDQQRRGYATEAVNGLVRHAFRSPEVARVIAHTLPDLVASIGVLKKTGFRFVGPGAEEGTICFELRREEA
jgi:RimJ/RimL family protein N-acetyltransferase